jgi:hypothetical protein
VIVDKRVPEINVDKLMQEIREAVPRRNNLHASASSLRTLIGSASLELEDIEVDLKQIAPGVDPPAPVQLSLSESDRQSIATPLPIREEAAYHFRDFLAYEDVDFVHAAYRAILKRDADEDGLSCYLTMLQDGARKAEILYRICRSPEGRQRDAKIGGLRLHSAFDSISRWPIFGRVIAVAVAIWNLPGTERSHRRLTCELGRRLTQNEQHSARYAKTATDALRRLEYSQNVLADMTKLFATRVHSEALQKALSGTVASLQALKKATKTHVDKGLLDAQIDELQANIETKAKSTAVEAAYLKIQLILETKADRRDSERWAKDVGASVRTIAEAKADTAQVAQVQIAIEDVAQKLVLLQESKASAGALRNLEVFLLSATETKAERHEITALTNHLVALLEHRATKNELEFLRSSIERTNEAIDNVRRDKADISDLDELGVEKIKRESRIAFEEIERTVQELADTRADHAAIAALRVELSATMENSSAAAIAEMDRKLDSLGNSKADRATIAALRSELSATVENSSAAASEALQGFKNEWDRKLDFLGQSKADQAAITAFRTEVIAALENSSSAAKVALCDSIAEMDRKLDSLGNSKADQAFIDTLKAEDDSL